jgi:hypothetical protein
MSNATTPEELRDQEYLENGGLCPNPACRKEGEKFALLANITKSELRQLTSSPPTVFRSCKCWFCGARWEELYPLSGISKVLSEDCEEIPAPVPEVTRSGNKPQV